MSWSDSCRASHYSLAIRPERAKHVAQLQQRVVGAINGPGDDLQFPLPLSGPGGCFQATWRRLDVVVSPGNGAFAAWLIRLQRNGAVPAAVR